MASLTVHVRVDESIENSRDRVSDRIAQKMSELAARELLHLDNKAVGDLHQQLCSSLESPCFPAQIVQHRVDVVCDLFDFFECIAIENRDHVMPDIREGLQLAQEIPDVVLGLSHLVGETVERCGHFPHCWPNLPVMSPICDSA